MPLTPVNSEHFVTPKRDPVPFTEAILDSALKAHLESIRTLPSIILNIPPLTTSGEHPSPITSCLGCHDSFFAGVPVPSVAPLQNVLTSSHSNVPRQTASRCRMISIPLRKARVLATGHDSSDVTVLLGLLSLWPPPTIREPVLTSHGHSLCLQNPSPRHSRGSLPHTVGLPESSNLRLHLLLLSHSEKLLVKGDGGGWVDRREAGYLNLNIPGKSWDN